MIETATISDVISTYGITILAPLAVVEGPIVTIVAAYLASLALLNPYQVFACVVLADLIGDSLLYVAGRVALQKLPTTLRQRLGATPERIDSLVGAFDQQGARMIVIGKLTHAAGFAVLMAAGAARMAFGPFLLANLAATLPKSLVLMAIGYAFGSAHVLIAQWISFGSAILFGVLALIAIAYLIYHKRRTI